MAQINPELLRRKAGLFDLFISDFNNLFLLQKSSSITRSYYFYLWRHMTIEKIPSSDKGWCVGGFLTVLVIDPNECHFKDLLASSTLALVGWYLASNLVLRRHGVT
ncbi:hypothetical protein PanWU01x14_020630 [Parasponia andersonii]|uniref:Uncharacterized protein n=1 Tax=Parasponia andersonii TaxID=3476 RepID=A0A2P5DYN9_PARAD|nr:hypothetical protein PanWU01x14_020630 [Parasponia andersonii]